MDARLDRGFHSGVSEEAYVEKRINHKRYQFEEIEKRQGEKNLRSEEVEDETEDEDEDVQVVEKRFEEGTGVAKGVNWIKPVARNVYNNMAGIIEALKSRGFNSASYVMPAREVV